MKITLELHEGQPVARIYTMHSVIEIDEGDASIPELRKILSKSAEDLGIKFEDHTIGLETPHFPQPEG